MIGLGVGEAHIEGFNKHPECEVIAICDFSTDTLENIGQKYNGVLKTRNAEELLENTNIDIISIASYDNYHAEQIVKAFENNKHVFVEKPLCLHEAEAIKIRATSNNHKHLKLSSNLILRKCPRFIKVKNDIENDLLGKIYYVEGAYNYGKLSKITDGWRGKLDFYSVTYGGGVHIIDLFLWLTKSKVKEVYAIGNKICTANTDFKYCDLVLSTLTFDNGAIGKLSCNFGCVHPHFHELKIYGTKGTFLNETSNGIYFKTKNELNEPEIINESYPGIHKGDLIYSFVESILNDLEPEVNKGHIFDAMSVAFAIEESLKLNKTIKVNYL
ncbi:MAG: Gfo/Idh/MocA family oxidoreductase [Bacteroidia bacterium]|nr:Gfo/Idh/MocA family oxidoreductase [Bacteroidia bacterium]